MHSSVNRGLKVQCVEFSLTYYKRYFWTWQHYLALQMHFSLFMSEHLKYCTFNYCLVSRSQGYWSNYMWPRFHKQPVWHMQCTTF